jgi:hypothetical protein
MKDMNEIKKKEKDIEDLNKEKEKLLNKIHKILILNKKI